MAVRDMRSQAATATTRMPGWRRTRRRIGMLYALPTAIYVAVFFVAPLLLVVRMSAGNWTLLGGDKGLNFPKNFTAIGSNTLFGPAVVFTIEYTVIVTVLLIGLGLGLALLVQEQRPLVRVPADGFLLPGAIGLATASLLFWGFYSPDDRADQPAAREAGADQRADPVPGDVAQRAAFDDVPDRLEVRRVLHADPARRAPGDPVRGV